MSTVAPPPPKHPPPWFVHPAWRAHRALYRLSGGRFLWTTSNKRGWGALRLTTIGRKSGHERSVIIGYLEDGPNLISIAMNGWDEGHRSWWLNLEAHADAVVRLTGQHQRRCARAWPRGRSVIDCGNAGSRSIHGSTPMPAGGRPRRP
jgi:deazaflavin-dependent oxidoreductase (nitroreductase family)